MKIKTISLFVFGLVLLSILAVLYKPYLLTGTPFIEGSGEWVGYTSAEANGFKTQADCVSDPETVNLDGFVIGCKRYVGQ